MINNLNVYYFLLKKLFNDDDRLEIIHDKNSYDEQKIEQANNIALGHENLKDDISLQPLKMPFYKVGKYTDKENKVYEPQSLTHNFVEKTSKNQDVNFKELSQKQFELFLEELNNNKEYTYSHDDNDFNESVIWQETVETIALKHLSFMGIKTDVKGEANVHPVSLFDHLRLTSSIYNVLENQEDTEKPYLYIQGDFFGIQKFIFSDVNKTEKNGAKSLRGRSAFVSILCELSAIKIINALKLPASARILTTAGKFNILAPNTEDNKNKLKALSQEIDDWFKRETFSIAGVGIAFNELSTEEIQGSDFNQTLGKLFNALSEKKYSRLNLLDQKNDENYIHKDYVNKFVTNDCNPCDFISYLPAKVENNSYGDGLVSYLADIQINLGAKIPTSKYLIIYSSDVDKDMETINSKENPIDILGYQINILAKDKFKDYNNNKIVRIYDIDDSDTKITNNHTYGKKFISAHTPPPHITFEEIAYTNITEDENGNKIGVPALASLKGDIDNLGNIFQDKETLPTLARTLYRSRMLDLYFSYRLSYLCKEKDQGRYKNIYVVFAGGDDFFLLGGSYNIIQFVKVFKNDFNKFVNNPHVHFSCGLGVFKSKHPVNYISHTTEKSLEQAKGYKKTENISSNLADKNAICCYGQTVSFDNWDILMGITDEFEYNKKLLVSTSAMYKWINFAEMSGKISQDKKSYKNAIWRSHFTYQAVRLKENDTVSQDYLISKVLPRIHCHKESFKIPLFTYLYNNRKYLGDK